MSFVPEPSRPAGKAALATWKQVSSRVADSGKLEGRIRCLGPMQRRNSARRSGFRTGEPIENSVPVDIRIVRADRRIVGSIAPAKPTRAKWKTLARDPEPVRDCSRFRRFEVGEEIGSQMPCPGRARAIVRCVANFCAAAIDATLRTRAKSVAGDPPGIRRQCKRSRKCDVYKGDVGFSSCSCHCLERHSKVGCARNDHFSGQAMIGQSQGMAVRDLKLDFRQFRQRLELPCLGLFLRLAVGPISLPGKRIGWQRHAGGTQRPSCIAAKSIGAPAR